MTCIEKVSKLGTIQILKLLSIAMKIALFSGPRSLKVPPETPPSHDHNLWVSSMIMESMWPRTMSSVTRYFCWMLHRALTQLVYILPLCKMWVCFVYGRNCSFCIFCNTCFLCVFHFLLKGTSPPKMSRKWDENYHTAQFCRHVSFSKLQRKEGNIWANLMWKSMKYLGDSWTESTNCKNIQEVAQIAEHWFLN